MISREWIQSIWRSAFLVGTLSSVAVGAHAQIVSFNFSGTIQSVDDAGTLLPADIASGTAYSGTITYDTSLVQGLNGLYRFEGPSANHFSMTVTVGSHTLAWNPSPALPNYIQIGRSSGHTLDYGARDFTLDGLTAPGSSGDVDMHLSLYDNTGTALSSDALPTSAPDLGLFNQPTFYFTRHNSSDYYEVTGTVTSLTPVPEPATTGAMVACGLAGFALWRRKNRSDRKV